MNASPRNLDEPHGLAISRGRTLCWTACDSKVVMDLKRYSHLTHDALGSLPIGVTKGRKKAVLASKAVMVLVVVKQTE